MAKDNKGYKAPKVKFDKVYLKRYYQLYILLALPLIYLLIFKYVPMWYILIAFKKYSIVLPVHKMAWAKHHGMEFFIKAFKSKDFIVALKNTIVLNLKDLIVGFPVPIIFALILNEIRIKKFKKVVQTITYMPHFLSWVVIYGIALQLFAPSTGLVNLLVERLGGTSINFLGEPGNWVRTYIGLGIWQSFGWNSIIYLAAIAGISPDLYEAASVDGASRFQKMWHITLPGIRSTIIVLLIMALGNIIGSGFDRPFAMANPTVLDKAEVIATYVYKAGIKGSQFSLTAAVGLFQSVVNVFFLLGANWLSRKFGERGIW